MHSRGSVRSYPRIVNSGPTRLCFVACSFPRTCSASSPTRLTYACKASRMARPHRYQGLIATLIKQKFDYGDSDGSMREGRPEIFLFSDFPARGRPGRCRERPVRPARVRGPVRPRPARSDPGASRTPSSGDVQATDAADFVDPSQVVEQPFGDPFGVEMVPQHTIGIGEGDDRQA